MIDHKSSWILHKSSHVILIFVEPCPTIFLLFLCYDSAKFILVWLCLRCSISSRHAKDQARLSLVIWLNEWFVTYAAKVLLFLQTSKRNARKRSLRGCFRLISDRFRAIITQKNCFNKNSVGSVWYNKKQSLITWKNMIGVAEKLAGVGMFV